MNTETKSYNWPARLWITAVIICIFIALGMAMNATDTLLQGKFAANTVKPSDSAYMLQQSFPSVWTILRIGLAVCLLIVWVRFPRKTIPPAAALFALALCGCGPARVDKFIEVGPNETAFVIPLQGNNVDSQGKFNSAEYLNSKKVAAKRIAIPLVEKNTGRAWFDYEWIDGVRVIKVNRAMVSREWSPPATGTQEKDESIPVVTRDSIQLGVGCAITAFIEEEDAATYLYYHGEAALAQVMDQNVRNWCVSELTREYGQLELNQAQTNFPAIFSRVFADAKAYFKTKGISIQQLGNAEGYEFKRPEIQKALNATFIAEQDNKTAQQEKIAQDTRNQKILASARTQREASEEIFRAKEAATMQNGLEIQMIQAKASLEMATKWNGALPANILPANSPLLLNLAQPSK